MTSLISPVASIGLAVFLIPCMKMKTNYQKDKLPKLCSRHFSSVEKFNKLDVKEKCKMKYGKNWPEDVQLFQPFEVDQILMNDFANCLSVKTFLNMVDLKYQIELRLNAEFMSPSGEVPFLKVGSILVSEFDPIITFVNAKGYALSESLSNEELSDMRSYITLTQTTLNNVLLYIMWVHEDNYNMITKLRNGFGYSWPLYKILPWKKKRQVMIHLKEEGWIHKSLDQVYMELDKCLQALSNKLGSKQFFFGSKPTELDALVFGYLFTILTTTLTDNQLLEKLKKYENLTDYCQNIHNLYFKNV